jgi:hypothetical protein
LVTLHDLSEQITGIGHCHCVRRSSEQVLLHLCDHVLLAARCPGRFGTDGKEAGLRPPSDDA